MLKEMSCFNVKEVPFVKSRFGRRKILGGTSPKKTLLGSPHPPPLKGYEINIKKSSGLAGIITSGLKNRAELNSSPRKAPFTAHE